MNLFSEFNLCALVLSLFDSPNEFPLLFTGSYFFCIVNVMSVRLFLFLVLNVKDMFPAASMSANLHTIYMGASPK